MTYINSFTTTTAPVKSNLTGYALSADWYACGYSNVSYTYIQIKELIKYN